MSLLPVLMRDAERSRLHGTGERIASAGYLRAVRFDLDLRVRTSASD